MSKTSVRKASVSIQSPDGKVSAESVVFSASINSAPVVEVTLRRGSAGVVTPLSADTIKNMKALQTARFALKNGPDTVVTADDGNGGKIEFTGYSIAPVLEQSKVSSAEAVNVVGVDSFLNGLNLSIYQSRPDAALRKEEASVLFAYTPNKVTGDIGALLKEVTEVLVKNLNPTLQLITTQSAQNVVQRKHDANKMALEVWYKILSNSDVRYPEWQTPFAELPKLGEAAAERTKQLLQQRTFSFWDALNGVMAEFQCFYRPNMDGSSGSLVRADSKTAATGAKTLQAGVIRFSATDGNPGMLPLRGIILWGPTLAKLRVEESAVSASTVVGQWPVEISAGYFQEAAAPSWLSAGAGGNFTPFSVKEVTVPDDEDSLDPTAYADHREELVNTLVVAGGHVSTILQAYAKVVYEDMRLADSTATLEIPLDFTIEVGVRYEFSLGDGGGSFSGFVRALRHSLQLQGGDQLTSGTTLTLTHIIYS